ncbi:MAG: serine hydrolase [Pseudomonadales bacterium]|nr:serine hydrolase [Pseudomonadales bacterium]
MINRLAIAAMLISSAVGSTGWADTSRVKVAKAESVGMSSDRLQRIKPGLSKFIEAGNIPGTVSLVARKGKVVHFEAQGLRNVATGAPMEKDTIFRLYSQSKPVTGAAIMLLFEEGHFLLTDPVSKYLPEFANMQVYAGTVDGKVETVPAKTSITIQQLLTHTSGLTYSFFPTPVGKMYVAAGVGGSAPESNLPDLKSWSEALAQQPLVAEPGTQWNYSVGMDVLGRLVEVVSGQSFREFLRERLFLPLGMNDTDFYVPADKLARFAANYSPTPESGMVLLDDPAKSPYSRLPKLEMGGSGLVGTVGDYFRFAQMLANRGELDGKRYLGSKTVEFMMSNHLTPGFPDDPLTSLFSMLGGGYRAWGVGFGLTGSVVTNPATAGTPCLERHIQLGWRRINAHVG